MNSKNWKIISAWSLCMVYLSTLSPVSSVREGTFVRMTQPAIEKTKQIVLDDAKREIKRVVAADPSVFTLSCTYKVFDGKPFLAQKRLYYKEYRKKSDYIEFSLPKKFSTKKPETIFEVTFKRPYREKFFSLICKDPARKNWRLTSELIELPSGFFA